MRVASDVGGTFTDLVWYDANAATPAERLRTTKAATTPPAFEQGVFHAIAKAGISPAAFEFFAHGSTVVINALTERKGAKTALLTTRGFRDVLEIARGNRPDLFNFDFRKPKPFVERALRLEIDERIDHEGQVLAAPQLDTLGEQLEFLRGEGVEAIAICFLHAYINPAHEIAVSAAIRSAWPEVSIIASHEVSRQWREYERSNTTVLAAYVHPVAQRYIACLVDGLVAEGFAGAPYLMQSNGGITSVAGALANPVALVESGPASGIQAASHLSALIDEPNLIVLDIGGTTAKCALIDEGVVAVSTDYYIERDGKSPGYPIQTPVLEILEIGNGGGSIAWLDEGKKLHVGPQSAGASPGPAAYGQGGTHATTTDANLLLGRIDPASFCGGEIEPDREGLQAAFEPLCAELDVSAEELARGIIRVANANMTTALRLISTNKGHDPREYALLACGGGGAMHALALAEELRIPRVIVPANSSVFSAWGMLVTDLRRDHLRTHVMDLTAEKLPALASIFNELCDTAAADMRDEQAGDKPLSFRYLLDMRYEGQEHTVKLELAEHPDAISIDKLRPQFDAAHAKLFTYQLDGAVEIVNFHLVAELEVQKPPLLERPVTGANLKDAVLGKRPVDFDQHGIHEASIYNGLALEPGMAFSGPAVIQEPAVTMPVPPGNTVTVDVYGNYHVALGS